MSARLLACAVAAAALSGGTAAATAADTRTPPPSPTSQPGGRLAGWLLVAAPGMPDPRFAGTVVFMLRHSEDGAMGLIVNRPIAVEPASKVLERILGETEPDEPGRDVRIQYGGPVEPTRGFFMHSGDYSGDRTVAVTDRVSLTSSPDVLRALARGKGPAKGFLAMGYAGWGPGQLEREIRRNDWVSVYPDDGIVFDEDVESKWRRAMDRRGADL